MRISRTPVNRHNECIGTLVVRYDESGTSILEALTNPGRTCVMVKVGGDTEAKWRTLGIKRLEHAVGYITAEDLRVVEINLGIKPSTIRGA